MTTIDLRVLESIGASAREIETLRAQLARAKTALEVIWHVAPLPTQTERERLDRIHGVARSALKEMQ